MSAVRQVHAARFSPFLALGLAAVAAGSVHAQSDPFTDTLAPGGAALGYLLRWERSTYAGAERSADQLPLYLYEGERAYLHGTRDRKSTRLNSSHMSISYAVFCL